MLVVLHGFSSITVDESESGMEVKVRRIRLQVDFSSDEPDLRTGNIESQQDSHCPCVVQDFLGRETIEAEGDISSHDVGEVAFPDGFQLALGDDGSM